MWRVEPRQPSNSNRSADSKRIEPAESAQMPAVGELLKTKDAVGRASPRAGRSAADSADNPAEQPFSLVRDAGTFVGMKPGPCEWPFDCDRPWRDRSASVQSVARETSSLSGARLRCNAMTHWVGRRRCLDHREGVWGLARYSSVCTTRCSHSRARWRAGTSHRTQRAEWLG